jgi:glycosyltransferase involved in cell wall biosynthesis
MVQQLRVVVVAPPYYEVPPTGYGGIERVCALLVNGLAARGHDVTLVAAGNPRTAGRFVQSLPVAPGEGTEDQVGVEVVHAAKAWEVIEELNPDVVHYHSRVGLLTARPSPPSIATVHYAVFGPESQAGLYRSLRGRVPLVAISDAQRHQAPGLPWIGRVHNGVNPGAYPFRADKEEFLLCLGRLSTTKGIDLAVAAARSTGRQLVVAGAATIHSERQWAEVTLGDRAGVEFIGEVSGRQRIALLSRAACLLHLARWEEPFGLDVVEAMACGTPVVATPRGALPEIIANGETGMLCDDLSSIDQAIAGATRCSAEDCRARVVKLFTADRMVDEYVQTYRRVVR